jgi:hypothetical protein
MGSLKWNTLAYQGRRGISEIEKRKKSSETRCIAEEKHLSL